MDREIDRIEQAARHTEILRRPRQHLATFGITNIRYYLLTEPSYSELVEGASETVIREGRVIADRPKIVTPYYLSHLDGFSADARRYFEMLLRMHGADTPGLFYTYKNEPKNLNIVTNNWLAVLDKLNDELDRKGDPLVSIIKGQDDLWDVSLLKFIYEITNASSQRHVSQLGSRGLLRTDASGIPVGARLRIEELFEQVARGECQPYELEKELNSWGAFEAYQDRFFSLVRRGK